MASTVHTAPSAGPYLIHGSAELTMVDRPALVGRDRELCLALRALHPSTGPGGVLIVGAPGVGKTRLGEEIVAAASSSGDPGGGPAAEDRSAEGALPAVPRATAHHVEHLTPWGVRAAAQRLLRAASRRPRILWVDDAHLVPPDGLESLRELVHQRQARLLLAVTADEVPAHFPPLWKDQHLVRVDLGPLDVLSTRRLASALLDHQLTQPSVVRLATMSAGNPLLLRELVRAALAQNLLVQDDSQAWRLGSGVPGSRALRELVARRLSPLSDDCRQVLELIALAEPAPLHVLEKIAPADTLLALEDQGLLRVPDPRGHRTGQDGSSVTVAHPYLGHVLRQSVAPLRRRHYLRTWAAALPPLDARRPVDRVRLTQWHLDAGDIPEQGLLLDSVAQALRDHDVPTAVRLAAAAWDAHPTAAAAELNARAMFAAAAFQDLHDFVAKVGLGHPEHATLLAPVEARAYLVEGRYEEADRVARELADGQCVALAAVTAFLRGRFSDALHHAEGVCRDHTAPYWMEAGLIAMGSLCRLGRPHDALDLYADLRERRDLRGVPAPGEPSLPFGEDSLEEMHALALLGVGRLEDAETVLTGEYRRVTQRSCVRVDAQRGLALGIALQERGRVRDALPHFAFTPAYQVGWQPWHAKARIHSALAHSSLPPTPHGQVADRLDDLEGGFYGAELAVARAWQAHRRGDQDVATGLLHAAGDAALDDGRYADAVLVFHELARLGLPAHPAVDRDIPLQGAFLRGRLHLARAVSSGDVKQLGQACRVLADAGALLYAAEGYAELARLQRRCGKDRAATASTAQARSLLAQCGEVATPPLHFLGETAALSPRERTVARLAAQGLTDKEIAGQLVVSPRTVSNTLYRIYQKVGASDRRHLRRLLSS
ncbi:LuxR C-terminal-related transcriptional regulator [Streptomyces sp. NPDC012935]|uniref:LuxR C-terminal-related transcriptional regulator n=1 Tax=Streptomyces sp. NPDC012935 TaxID=3364857 RepID=UPI0036C78265